MSTSDFRFYNQQFRDVRNLFQITAEEAGNLVGISNTWKLVEEQGIKLSDVQYQVIMWIFIFRMSSRLSKLGQVK